MTKRIISISGFGASGKTMCTNLLFDRLESVAIVEADQFFRIKPFEFITQKGREQTGRIKLNMSIALTKTFCEEHIEHIIIDGLVWSQAELDAVVANGKNYEYDVWSFWLKADKAARIKRALTRKRDEADTEEFLSTVEQEIPDPTPLSIANGRYHEIITDNLTTADVVEEIMNKIEGRF